ncbi:RNA polymerase sigma factor [Paenibacillus sp. MWE-103]|uniref:RNA polymerase sigma factor n=1 Tax=Paenibacillus artemisiicola TaxID=1172618 RepID=A0ABS3WKX9_9BACL|nr:RNA polymerase sigma factor [Paenibacillus artemisiicola]
MTEIEEWVKQVQSGNVVAYEAIAEQFSPPLYRYCFRMLNQVQEAEDAVQDVLIKAYESIGAYKQSVSFGAWIFSIAYRHCLNVLRRRKLQLKFSWLFHQEEHEESPEQIYDKHCFSPLMIHALSKLSPKDRSLLIFRIFEDRSYVEIGEMIGSKPEAVKKRIARAKEKIRQQLHIREEDIQWQDKITIAKMKI